MTAGTLVVVAAGPDDASTAVDHLREQGAEPVEAVPASPARVLVYGRFGGDTEAAAVVAELRNRGWAATTRPVGGGHLTAWRHHTSPLVVADRVWICFPWSELDRAAAPLLVEIDPGSAFGTGSHPTTRLALEELAAWIEPGQRVLDVGCGSGVLGVTAARLGAGSVTAVDVNPAAVAATRANADRNGVGAVVDASDRPLAEVGGSYDAVLANIGAAVLVELAPAIQSRLAPGGWLVLGGLSPAQVSVVSAAYRGVDVVAVRRDDDWAAIVATDRRPRPAPSSSHRTPRRGTPGRGSAMLAPADADTIEGK